MDQPNQKQYGFVQKHFIKMQLRFILLAELRHDRQLRSILLPELHQDRHHLLLEVSLTQN